jgi:hypothetical protein
MRGCDNSVKPSPKRWRRLALTAAPIAALVLPSVAHGAEVSATSSSIRYVAAAGESNALTVDREASTGRFFFTETGSVPLTALGDCFQATPHSAVCPNLGVGATIDISLGDQVNGAIFTGNFQSVITSVHGGPARDRLDAHAVTGGNFRLFGEGSLFEHSDDTLRGGAGDDVLVGGAGADLMSGGGGEDVVSYEDHSVTQGVTATLDGLANDGAPGIDGGTSTGADTITPDVEDLTGGDGADHLTGGSDNNTIDGGFGCSNDVLSGLGGADTLEGGSGADTFSGGTGEDTVSYADHLSAAVSASLDGVANDGRAGTDGAGGTCAGPAADSIGSDIEDLVGSASGDTLIGNNGRNALTGGPGSDQLSGLGETDLLLTNDGFPDTVSCGDGTDTANVDLKDGPAGLPDCEVASQAQVGQHPTVAIGSRKLRLHGPGHGRAFARVRLRCPRKLHRGCHGILTLSRLGDSAGRSAHPSRPKVIGRARYAKIAAGASRTVEVAIDANAARSVRRHGPVEVRVEALEHDPQGKPKRTFKTLKLSPLSERALV